MYFEHSTDIWNDFPELVAGVLVADGVNAENSTVARIDRFTGIATERLATAAESEFPEIQAWRRTFSRMGLKPTQYRCASEAMLRRFRKDKSLPQLHPLVDVCNAMSIAFAIPIAVFDIAEVAGHLEVRRASGEETYLTFGGETENPEPGEVIFADEQHRAHARRWTNRQSRYSAVQPSTGKVLIVVEALHDSAGEDVTRLLATVAEELEAVWGVRAKSATLGPQSRRFEF
ncbi:B3/4 domain-containing protein [Saccharopolyspora sp. ASAGF58]|uniref:B3/B4 domain-containing protein n=1 Tax=Saccharopolyspora TaxID=1835 RepID=UPI00143FF7B2|nr:phenylalanine--tRNA ligase beta subunit-related protein [Saccharopolyspora sp. ASAGF58]QIZ36322.1 hypothetical protein FDZ84_18640 [Saccharopolyspora sp. ASAGF58]